MWAQSAIQYDDGPTGSGGTISFTSTATTFDFSLSATPVAPSTVTLHAPGSITATDNGSGAISGSGIAGGSTINYSTGAVHLVFSSAPGSGSITADYTGSGYGVGTGVIDEDGRHTTWMGTMGLGDYSDNCNAGVLVDLNAFAYLFVKQYATTVVSAIKAVDTNHLIFGPDAINNYGVKSRTPVLQGLSDGGIDVFELSYDPLNGPLAHDMSENNATYDLIGKPAIVWYSVVSNLDSRYVASPGSDGSPQFTTQALRGQHMRDVDAMTLLNATGSNGDRYVIGYNWWSLYDSGTEGGGTNWGLISFNDNAYDGHEDTSSTVLCSTPIATLNCGGEPGIYGDFLSYATTANNNIVSQLLGANGSSHGGNSSHGGKGSIK